MDISLFLAQVFGLYFILAGVAILVRPSTLTELLETFSHRTAVFIGGFMALIIGIPLVLLHNVWNGTWQVLITLLVWATLIKGITLIFVPNVATSWIAVFRKHQNVTKHFIWVVIVFGLYLAYIGFGWNV